MKSRRDKIHTTTTNKLYSKSQRLSKKRKKNSILPMSIIHRNSSLTSRGVLDSNNKILTNSQVRKMSKSQRIHHKKSLVNTREIFKKVKSKTIFTKNASMTAKDWDNVEISQLPRINPFQSITKERFEAKMNTSKSINISSREAKARNESITTHIREEGGTTSNLFSSIISKNNESIKKEGHAEDSSQNPFSQLLLKITEGNERSSQDVLNSEGELVPVVRESKARAVFQQMTKHLSLLAHSDNSKKQKIKMPKLSMGQPKAFKIEWILNKISGLEFKDTTSTEKMMAEAIQAVPGAFNPSYNNRKTALDFSRFFVKKMNFLIKKGEKVRSDVKGIQEIKKEKEFDWGKFSIDSYKGIAKNFSKKLDLTKLLYSELYIKLRETCYEHAKQLSLLFNYMLEMVESNENLDSINYQLQLIQAKSRFYMDKKGLRDNRMDLYQKLGGAEVKINKLNVQKEELIEEIQAWKGKCNGIEHQINKYKLISRRYKEKHDTMKTQFRKMTQLRLHEQNKVVEITTKYNRANLDLRKMKKEKENIVKKKRRRSEGDLFVNDEIDSQNSDVHDTNLTKAERKLEFDLRRAQDRFEISLINAKRGRRNAAEPQQLHNAIIYKDIDKMVPTEKMIKSVAVQASTAIEDKSTQTDLVLASKKYDVVFGSPEKIEKIVEEHQVKRKLESKLREVRKEAKTKLMRVKGKLRGLNFFKKGNEQRMLNLKMKKTLGSFFKEILDKKKEETGSDDLETKSMYLDDPATATCLSPAKVIRRQNSAMNSFELAENKKKKKYKTVFDFTMKERNNLKEKISKVQKDFYEEEKKKESEFKKKIMKDQISKTYKMIMKVKEGTNEKIDYESLLAKMAEMYEMSQREKKISQQKYEGEVKNNLKLQDSIYSLNLQIQKLKEDLQQVSRKNTEGPLDLNHNFPTLNRMSSGSNQGDELRPNKAGRPLQRKSVSVIKPYARYFRRRIKKKQLFKKNKAYKILDSVRKAKKLKNSLPVKSILKLITQIYNERVKEMKNNSSKSNSPLIEFIYDYYLHSFGFPKIAEPKYKAFLAGVKNNLKIWRINLFSRFIGLSSETNAYNMDQFYQYIDGLKFLQASNIGLNITQKDHERRYMLPYLRCSDYLKRFCDLFNLKTEEVVELRNNFDRLKQSDFTGKNKAGVIDQDRFLHLILENYTIFITRTKQFVKNAFKAADLDGNGLCSKDEFQMLWKYINPESYDEEKASKIFDDRADDYQNDNEPAMKMERFSVVAAENRLFQEQKQFQFIGVKNKKQLIDIYKKLEGSWAEKKDSLRQLFKNLKLTGKYSEDIIEGWIEVIDEIDKEIVLGNERNNPTLLISLKILELETGALLEDQNEDENFIKVKRRLFKLDSCGTLNSLEGNNRSRFRLKKLGTFNLEVDIDNLKRSERSETRSNEEEQEDNEFVRNLDIEVADPNMKEIDIFNSHMNTELNSPTLQKYRRTKSREFNLLRSIQTQIYNDAPTKYKRQVTQPLIKVTYIGDEVQNSRTEKKLNKSIFGKISETVNSDN